MEIERISDLFTGAETLSSSRGEETGQADGELEDLDGGNGTAS